MYSQPSPQPVSSKQADWLQLLTEINPAPVVFSRISDGMILYVTDRATQLFGWAVGEIFDFHHINLYPDPADRVLFLEQLSRNGTVQDCTVQIFCRDGTSFWGVISIEQRLFQGEPIAVTLIRDVTETMMLERQIQERTAQLQQILSFEATLKRITDKVRDSLDENQIIQTAVRELAVGLNAGCCNSALYNLDERASTICYEYTLSMPAYHGRIANMTEYPQIYDRLLQGEYLIFCSTIPNPARGRVAMLACPILDDKGVLGDLWLINREDYYFKESEVRLVQQVANQCAIAIRQARLYQSSQSQIQELEKLNRLKDDFLSTVSHELRTPVSNMRMAIQMLRVATTPERQERYLDILQSECIREADLINDLLDLQHLEASAYPITTDVVLLDEWLPSVVEPFLDRAQTRQQLLIIEMPENLPPLKTHCTSLGRILGELLNNACKYTVTGGKIILRVYYHSPAHIHHREADLSAMGQLLTATDRATLPSLHHQTTSMLASLDSQESAFYFVLQNQAEIPVTELPRIFEKFYRVPNADPWKQGGTGLGLALVRKLVEKLQGQIRVDSRDGWTVFVLGLTST